MAFKYDNTGVSFATPFNLGAEAPLDARQVVQDKDARNALVTEHKAYTGMSVYVLDDNMLYLYDGTDWKVLATSTSTDGSADINDILDSDIEGLFAETTPQG